MTWLHKLSHAKIPFTIYKIESLNSFICSSKLNLNHIFIIIHGFMYVTKIYYNNEKIPLTLLFKGQNLYTENLNKDKYYYEYKSINTTYIISLNKYYIGKQQKKNLSIMIYA